MLIFFVISSAVAVAAKPPRAVSRRSTFMSLPTLRIAPTTSSNGIILEIPARAMSAANTAFAAPIALRFIQGHSTSPATGSHTSPSMFLTAIADALNEAAGDAPQSSASAAAAIADAEPISAWHPPSAPEMLALRAIITPTALLIWGQTAFRMKQGVVADKKGLAVRRDPSSVI